MRFIQNKEIVLFSVANFLFYKSGYCRENRPAVIGPLID